MDEEKKKELMKAAQEAQIKIETVGTTGCSVETKGPHRGLLMKVGIILQSLIVGEVISLEELQILIESLEEINEDPEEAKQGLLEHIELKNPTPEELEQAMQKIKDTIGVETSKQVKRKCLVCPEKDTCKNKWLDIQCNKY